MNRVYLEIGNVPRKRGDFFSAFPSSVYIHRHQGLKTAVPAARPK